MATKSFHLRVPLGTRLISSQGDYTVEGVPSDALARVERGASWLGLTEEALPELRKLSDERLRKLLQLREAQGFDDDVAIIQKALTKEESTAKKK